MTGNAVMYTAWLDLYERAWAAPEDVASLPCVTCGHRTLRLIFITELTGAPMGRAVFWCNTCLNGLMPLRAPVPANAEVVEEGQENVPDYHLVIEE